MDVERVTLKIGWVDGVLMDARCAVYLPTYASTAIGLVYASKGYGDKDGKKI